MLFVIRNCNAGYMNKQELAVFNVYKLASDKVRLNRPRNRTRSAGQNRTICVSRKTQVNLSANDKNTVIFLGKSLTVVRLLLSSELTRVSLSEIAKTSFWQTQRNNHAD